MNVVSKKTAVRIANAHIEVENANELLKELAELQERQKMGEESNIRDAFGRCKSNFEFGVPMGKGSHRLFSVTPNLAEYVIKNHIIMQGKELAEASLQAKLEMDEQTKTGTPESD